MAYNLNGTNATLILNPSGVQSDPNGPYFNTGAPATLTLDDSSGGVVVESAGAIIEAGGVLSQISLTLEGAGQFEFLGVNTFTGAVTILGTTVSVGANGALGIGSITFNSGSNFAALESVTSNFSTAQAVTIDSGSGATLEAAAGDTLTSTGTIDWNIGSPGQTLHIGSTTDTGIVALDWNGYSSTALPGSSNALSVDGGELKILNSTVAVFLGLVDAKTLNGVLDIDGQSMTLDNLAGNGVIENSGAAATLTISGSFGGVITGATGIVDLGGAQLTFTGGGETINFAAGSGNVASIFSTGSIADSVNGSYGTINLASAQTSVFGGGDTIDFAGSGDVVSLSSTFPPDTVNGSNGRSP
jgi:hypothetical protein